MTAPAAIAPPERSAARRPPPQRTAHPALWLAAAVALLPVVVPFLLLVGRAAAGGSTAIDTVFSLRTLELIRNTGLLVAAVSCAAGMIGVGAAWITERTDLPGRAMWRVVVGLPLVLPSYVIALTVISSFGSRGLLAQTVGIGLPSLRGFWSAFWALTVATYPFVYLIVAAALRRLDPSIEDAARGLGATGRESFSRVVLPQVRPAIGAGVLLTALYTLSDFGAVSLAGYDSFTRVVYAQYAGRLDRTPAIVLAVLLMGLALLVLLAEGRIRRGRTYVSNAQPQRQHLVTLSSSQRHLATSLLGLLGFVALAIPVGALVTWVVRDPAPAGLPWGSLAGSLSVSLMAAAGAGLLAIPVALLVVRHRRLQHRWVERVAYLAYSVPHITVGLAMVVVASRWLGPLYQSLVVLIAVYVSVFFAQALGSVRTSLAQVSPTLEDAARTLGKTRFQTVTGVIVPLIRPGVAAGALLVFLTTMKELPITLLLRPTGLDTLAVDVWSASSELLYSTAAVPALILLVISAIPTFLLATRQR